MRVVAITITLFVAACASEQGSKEAFNQADAQYVKLLQIAKSEPTYENRRRACEGWYEWYLALEEFEDEAAASSLHAYYTKLSDEHLASCAVDRLADGTLIYVPKG